MILRGRFEGSVLKVEEVKNSFSRITLRCSSCNQNVTPTIEKFVNGIVGCGCTNTTELRVAQIVREEVDDFCKGRYEIHAQDKFYGCKGKGGRCLPFDIMVYDLSMDQYVLNVEVDGAHHFVSHCPYDNTFQQENHTLDHDLIKEEFVTRKLDCNVLRICQRYAQFVNHDDEIREAISMHVQMHMDRVVGDPEANEPGISWLPVSKYKDCFLYASRRAGTHLDPRLGGDARDALGIHASIGVPIIDERPRPPSAGDIRTYFPPQVGARGRCGGGRFECRTHCGGDGGDGGGDGGDGRAGGAGGALGTGTPGGAAGVDRFGHSSPPTVTNDHGGEKISFETSVCTYTNAPRTVGYLSTPSTSEVSIFSPLSTRRDPVNEIGRKAWLPYIGVSFSS